ncbi:Chromosome partition protein Smc [Ferriphaselus amnicola]|uniref:Chromosome partition protein Smc n=1 Tax=Ferriphaselus amnicola TaxID=1188319 RepID=A0A2Z6GCI2_9PROT|nr:phage tail tape measure protein [Ferriphaselus amnicola]BBE51150.1 Chromosome partition protein Smc [Ferriphaselus amnicola]
MLDRLQLTVQLGLVEKILKPLKAIQGGSNETAKALKAAKDKLKELNDQQKNIDGFRSAAKGIAIHRQELTKAEERIRTIKQAMEAAQYPTKAMQQAFKEATTEANHLKGNITRLTEKQELLRRELSASGADTHKLASYQRELKTQLSSSTAEVDKQKKALDQLNEKMNRIRATKYAYEKSTQFRDKIAGAGATTSAAGVAMGLPIVKVVKDYASFEDAMLGVARQVDGAKDANGRYTQTYYEMGDAIKAMSERIPLATTEIAAIVEAGARAGIQGKDNLLTYAETTAIMASAFDLPVDQIGEDVGKIAGLYKIPIKSISELGDTINWLDDNARSKSGDIIDVMKRIAGTADTVGMKYKDAAALASTFLSLGATSEVSATASNAIMTNLSIATMQPKRFQEGLGMIGMSGKGVQQDMSKDATGTILKVMDAIKKLPQAKQLEATTRLFGKEFGDDAAKLAANLGEYRRQLELTNAAQAKGSMQREADSRNQALSARYEMLKSTIFNVSSALGESLKPALVDIMQSIADVLSSVRAWTKEHPALTANLIKGAAIIATIVTVLGALTLAAAAVLGPLALLKLSMSVLSLNGFGLTAMLSRIALTILPMVSSAVWTLGAAIMFTPIGWLLAGIAALATSALLIYKYWEPIKAFFAGFWDGFSSAVGPALKQWWAAFKGFIASMEGLFVFVRPIFNFVINLISVLFGWLIKLIQPISDTENAARNMGESFGMVIGNILANLIAIPTKCLEIGAAIMHGIGNGILSAFGWVEGIISRVADLLPSAFKNKLRIHSPSRVFAELGNFTMLGLEQGIMGGKDGPLGAVAKVSKELAGIGLGIGLSGAAAAQPITWDTRPPLSASASGSSVQQTFAPVIQVYATPGMNEQQLAQAVARELEKLQRQQAARTRSRLSDTE